MNDFCWHGRQDLLAAFGFEGAVAAAAPRAGIEHFGGEFAVGGLQGERASGGGRDAHFIRFSVKENGEDVGGDFDGVGVERFTVERNAPAFGVANDLDSAGPVVYAHCDFHGVRSSWSRRASWSPRGGRDLSAPRGRFFYACG